MKQNESCMSAAAGVVRRMMSPVLLGACERKSAAWKRGVRACERERVRARVPAVCACA